MIYAAATGRLFAWLTFLVAMVLQLMPLPEVIEQWRPDWLLLIMICWALHRPHRYGVLTAFVLGVLLDVLLGATLGVRALGFSICTYLVLFYQQRLVNYPRWQQALVVMAIMMAYHLIVFWVEFILGNAEFDLSLFYPAFIGVIFWRWAYWMIRRIALKYKVN